jgi:hypothetical protein
MNRQASINRVARVHTARVQKRAALLDKVKEPVAIAFLESEAEKQKKHISSEGASGLKALQKSLGLRSIDSFIKAIGQSKHDPKDPIQKMIAEATSRARSIGEAGDILGRFVNAYQKRDVAEMANVVGVEEKTMAIVLLWYVKDNKSLAVRKASVSKISTPEQAAMVEKALDLVGTVGSEVVKYLDAGWQWLYNFAWPKLGAGWKGVLFLLDKAWWGVSGAVMKAGGLIKSAIVSSTSAFGILAVLKVLGIGILVYYTLIGLSWLSYNALRTPGRIIIEFPLKAIYNILKRITKGAIKISKKLYRLIKGALSGSDEALDPEDPMLPVVEEFTE